MYTVTNASFCFRRLQVRLQVGQQSTVSERMENSTQKLLRRASLLRPLQGFSLISPLVFTKRKCKSDFLMRRKLIG